MRPLGERRVGGPGPCPVRLNLHDHRRGDTINGDGDARTRLANPGEGWRTVAGVKHAVGQLAVRDGVNLRHGWRLRINLHRKDRTYRANVTGIVHRGDGDIQRAVGLCRQGIGPFIIDDLYARDFHAVVVDDHRLAGGAGSADAWRSVVGRLAILHATNGTDNRSIRGEGIDRYRDTG